MDGQIEVVLGSTS